MIVIDHVYTSCAIIRELQPNSKIETQNSNPYRNYAFDQLIDKNVHVPDNGQSARDARCPGWAGNLRAGMV